MKSTPALLLIDGSAMMYAAYYAMPPLSAPNGAPTGAIKGFDSMLKQLRNRFAEARCVVVFDAKGKTFRHHMAPSYKATRKPMPVDLVAQIESIQTLPTMLGLPMIIEQGVEADDVIGTLAHQASTKEIATVIVTPDKDMNQLINKYVAVYNMRKDSWMTAMSVEKHYGISVAQFIDYLALIGDTSDNIPGVDKVGPKTASKLLNKYGTLDALLEHAESISGTLGHNLIKSKNTIPLNKELLTIKCDLDITLADYQHTEVDEHALAGFYQTLGFMHQAPIQAIAQDQEIDYLHTNSDIEQLLTLITSQSLTCAVYPVCAEDTHALLGVALHNTAKTAYIPIPKEQTRTQVANLLCALPKGIYLDAKYLMRLFDIVIEDVHIVDLSLMSYVLNPTAGRTLAQLAHTHLDALIANAPYPPNATKKERISVEEDETRMAQFATQCAITMWDLQKALEKTLATQPKLQQVLDNIELPLLTILVRMEQLGALLDCQLLNNYSAQIADELNTLETQIFAHANAPFNVNSTKQVQDLLFKQLGLKAPKKTKGGSASTSESTLQMLNHPVADHILEYRKWQKLKTGYTDSLPAKVDVNNRVHTTFNQTIVSTGRLSSSHPNLQNIPVKTQEGKMIRTAFIAKEGYSLLSADYSQIELRIMAHLSADATMVADFQAGTDIHTSTAAQVFEHTLAEVSSAQRRQAKAINFGLIYGTTPFGLAKQLDVDVPQAQRFIDTYFHRYQGVHAYMEKSKKTAKEQGFVQTVVGRQLAIATINDNNSFVRAAAERLAINAPIQGSAADIIKLAMIEVDKWIKQSSVDVAMILQVHDELVFEVRDDLIAECTIQIPQLMSRVMTLSVPLVVDVGCGKNWSEAH